MSNVIQSDDSDNEEWSTQSEDMVPLSFLQGKELPSCDDEGNPHGPANELHGLFTVVPGVADVGCDRTLESDLDSKHKSIAESWVDIPFSTRVKRVDSTDPAKVFAATLFETKEKKLMYYVHHPQVELDCVIQTAKNELDKEAIVAASDPAGAGLAVIENLSAKEKLEAVPMYAKYPLSPGAYHFFAPTPDIKIQKPKSQSTKTAKLTAPPVKKQVPKTAVRNRPVLNINKVAKDADPQQLALKPPKSTPKVKTPSKRKAKELDVSVQVKKQKPEIPTPEAKPEIKPAVASAPPPSAVSTVASPAKCPVRIKIIIESDGPLNQSVLQALGHI